MFKRMLSLFGIVSVKLIVQTDAIPFRDSIRQKIRLESILSYKQSL